MKRPFVPILLGIIGAIVLGACTVVQTTQVSSSPASNAPPATGEQAGSSEAGSTRDYSEYRIVTLLPRDAIPAIDNPQFLSADEADEEYAPDELIIGVEIDGDARAYSIPFLSGREIVNDTVGGAKIAVTW